MVRQFLLLPDGSVPPNITQEMLAVLQAEGIPLTIPTPRWTPAEGYMLVEADPTQDANGVWRQTWLEVPIPEPEPTPEPPPAPYQFARAFTLDELSTMRDLAVQTSDPQSWADSLIANGYATLLT